MRRHYITIKDIARELAISVSTVSRALRDAYDVNPKTREKVLAKAMELNYKPNFNAIGLVQSQSHHIGVLMPAITNYYFSTVFTGIEQVANANGYNLIVFITNDSAEREQAILQDLSLSSLDGLLVSVSSQADSYAHFEELIRNGIPVVFFDRVADAVLTSKVMQDDYHGAYAATQHLIDQGYRRIAHLAGPAGLTFTQKRQKGYEDALTNSGLQVRSDWVIHSGFSQECGFEDVARLWTLAEKPDALFAVNDRKAIGAMLALKERNVQIGKEVGVIGFTNDPMSQIISPTLTTVAEPAFEIGKLSCELLLKHMTRKNVEAQEVILPARLIVRESTRR
ncbi:LacI family DNA-binding transcriptional regulator [Larkinella sp. GY13]|uniref:LacI family DNA-binding transcriptional regulator n=1 Tax=Larkinella sp. GY13 TaxID=3453720 RepID=UPI003EF08422